MGFRDDKEMVIGNDTNANKSSHDELSDIWQKLLGIHPAGKEVTPDSVLIPSSLADDPWSQLLQTQGARIVDLQQHTHLQETQISLSELEVEQALQIMQEQPVHSKNQT